MTLPPNNHECSIILQWMNTYFDGPLEPWEREWVRDNYWRDEFEEGEQWTVQGFVMEYLTPLPESLEKELRKQP